MTKNYDIRPWQPGDETAILALFEQSYGRTLPKAFWDWRFKTHPAGGPLITLAWDNDRLIAHYAASHAPLLIDGESVPAALSMTTMTHPDYRGQGLVEVLGDALYSDLSAQGSAGIWGFPNPMFHTTLQKKLGWDSICDVATLSLSVQAARVGKQAQATPAQIVPAIDARFGSLAHRIAAPGTIQSLRTQDVLAWRIDQNPTNTYTRFVVGTSEAIDGYAIVKTYGDGALDIVDLCAVDHETVTALLVGIVDHAKQTDKTQLNTWSLNADMARFALERFGFAATAPVTYMGGRSFQGRLGDSADVRRWRLAMLDSDLY